MNSSVVAILAELVSLPSVNPMGGAIDESICFESRVSGWLVDFFRSIGAPCEQLEVRPGRSNVIARYDSPGADFTILLDAHQDTVPVEGMTIPPFTPKIADGRLWGRGACDVKGGLAAMLFAFRRLIQERPAGAANVILSCTCDEEATILGITDLVTYWSTACGRSKLLNDAPDMAIIAEPTELDVVVAHRGVTRFKVRTKGRACHSSDPSQGVNAIYRMARLVSTMQEYADNLNQTVKAHPLCGSASLSVGKISGGTSVNIVPDECVIEVDRRVTPGEYSAGILTSIREFLTARLDFDFEFDAPWIECSALTDANNADLANAVLRCVAPVDGPHSAVGVPYGTHASQTCAAGVPSIVFGPGSIQQAHTKDEYIEISQLEKAAEVYFQVCAGGSSLIKSATSTI